MHLVEDRAGRELPLRVARGTLDAILGHLPSHVALAGRTHEPLRLAKSHEIHSPVRISTKLVFELQLGQRVILCTRLDSNPSIMLKPELSAYPIGH